MLMLCKICQSKGDFQFREKKKTPVERKGIDLVLTLNSFCPSYFLNTKHFFNFSPSNDDMKMACNSFHVFGRTNHWTSRTSRGNITYTVETY